MANLMHNRIAIVENTRVQFSYKVIKILCFQVLFFFCFFFSSLFNTLKLSYDNNIRSNTITTILQFYGSLND